MATIAFEQNSLFYSFQNLFRNKTEKKASLPLPKPVPQASSSAIQATECSGNEKIELAAQIANIVPQNGEQIVRIEQRQSTLLKHFIAYLSDKDLIGSLEPEILEVLTSGACNGLSTLWGYWHLLNQHDHFFKYNDRIIALLEKEGRNIKEEAEINTFMREIFFLQAEFSNARSQAHPEHYLKIVSEKLGTLKNAASIVDNFKFSDTKSFEKLLKSLVEKDAEKNKWIYLITDDHVMSLFSTPDRVYFYDPNVGEIHFSTQILDLGITEIIASIQKVYHETDQSESSLSFGVKVLSLEDLPEIASEEFDLQRVHKVDNIHTTPLIIAADMGDITLMERISNKFGLSSTFLSYAIDKAVETNNLEFLKYLMEKENCSSSRRASLLTLARSFNHSEMAEFLAI